MLENNFYYQILFFLFCIISGFYCVFQGLKKDDKKTLAMGIFLFTWSWSAVVAFIGRFDLDPTVKNMFQISKPIVMMVGLIYGAICVKKWRSYVFGLGFFLVIMLGIVYKYITR